jgi:hypothetical protein
MPKFVIYSDNNKKYTGFFTGKRSTIGTLKSKLGISSVNYEVSNNILDAKIYTMRNADKVASNMSKKDFWGKIFKAVPIQENKESFVKNGK